MEAFWDEEVDKSEPGLSGACGCYVISVHEKVWYVGLAQKQDFVTECSTPHKMLKLINAARMAKGDAALHFIAPTTPGGKFAKPSPTLKDIAELETMLIMHALKRNKHLLNKRETKFIRSVVVPGILNSRQGYGKAKSVRSLTTVLGIGQPTSIEPPVELTKSDNIDEPQKPEDVTPNPSHERTRPPAGSEGVSYGTPATMLVIRDLLANGQAYSVEELAAKTGKSLSTIRTNITYMRAANSPIGPVPLVKGADGKYHLQG